MKTSIKQSLKVKGWLPALLVTTALMLSGAPRVWADNDHHDSDRHDDSDNGTLGGKTLAKVFHDTYWRWFYGNLTLPKDENANAVLGGIALLPLPNAPGDGTPGSINITLRAGQSFFLPLFGFQGTTYTDGTPPDPFLDLDIFKTLIIKFTIDGKTVVDSKNVMDYFAQSSFIPPFLYPGAPIDVIWNQSIGVLREPLSPGKHVLKLDVKNTIPGFGFISEFHNTFNITVSPRVVPPTERYEGRTYAEWSAEWQEWALEFPVNNPNDPHPSVDSPKFDVRDRQSGDVWFLAGPSGPVQRTITIPEDKALFFPLANVEVSNLEVGTPFFGATEAAQRAQAKLLANRIGNLFCTIDGVPVGPASSYRVSSPQFRFDAPTPWINSPSPGGRGKAVGDGYYVLVEPLPKGDHTLHFGATFHFLAGDFGPGSTAFDVPYDLTYHVKVR